MMEGEGGERRVGGEWEGFAHRFPNRYPQFFHRER